MLYLVLEMAYLVFGMVKVFFVFGILDCGVVFLFFQMLYLVFGMFFCILDVFPEMSRDQSPGRGFCRLTKTTFPNLSLERSTDYNDWKTKIQN